MQEGTLTIKQIVKRALSALPIDQIPLIKLPVNGLPSELRYEPPGDTVSSKRAFSFLANSIPIVMNHPSPQSVQRLLSLLRPLDVVGPSLVRKGRNGDGGYVMLDAGIEGVAYSLGVNDEVSWDVDMVKAGCQVYQYDHTVSSAPVTHPSIHFFKTGIAAENSPDGVFKSLEYLLETNGHRGRRDLILKMDIEGSEWEVIEGLQTSTLDQFSQILAEWHFPEFSNIADPEELERVLSVFEKLNQTHQVIHVHANNYGRMGIIGGVSLVEGLEVTYLRRDGYQFKPCRRLFPTPLDCPNNACLPDYPLGALGQL
jgi:hypothetical protein